MNRELPCMFEFHAVAQTFSSMRVAIEQERILIDEKVLNYYPYYFAIWKDGIDHRLVAKKVLSQWASAIETLETGREAVYLPYYLNDQICRFLKAEADDSEVVLTSLDVYEDGWAIDLDDISREMYSTPRIAESFFDVHGRFHDNSPELLGRFNASELIEALRAAEIRA